MSLYDKKIRTKEKEVSISELPVIFTLHRAEVSEFEKITSSGIGYLEYFPSLNSQDGVVDEKVQLNGAAILNANSFDCALKLLADSNFKSKIAIDLKGLVDSGSYDKVWNAESQSKLVVVDARVSVQQKQVEHDPTDNDKMVTILNEIRQLRAQITKGVRVRLFD